MSAMVRICFITDNELDGGCFMELTEEEFKGMYPQIGIVKKMIRIQKTV